MKTILGTRGSPLALRQADWVARELKNRNSSLQVEIKIVQTKGDKVLDTPIWKIGDKGLFVKELEMALQSGQIDLAVHSVKDLPAEIPDELFLAAFPAREEVLDVLVTRENIRWDKLPHEAIVGTSALRRQSQLLHHRPDLHVKMLRGNVDTRLRKLDQGEYFAIVVAKAGLNRLGISRGTALPSKILLPSPGQGALAIQTRKDDIPNIQLSRQLDHPPTAICIRAERAFLLKMEGGCQLPLGALARLESRQLTLEGFFGTADGKAVIRDYVEGDRDNPQMLGEKLADRMLEGGKTIMQVIRKSCVGDSPHSGTVP